VSDAADFATDAEPGASGRLAPRRRSPSLELVVVILLGVVSVATAYASFQAALYDSHMASNYTRGQNAQTEAESLYLEANQQYMQDAETWNRLLELEVEMRSADPETAAAAEEKADWLLLTSVDEDFADAIAWAMTENEAHPGEYVSPLEHDEYLSARFGAYEETKAQGDSFIAQGDLDNANGDRLTLYTVLMAITLFLLGVAAVVRHRMVAWTLIVIGTAIFLVSAVLTAMVPFVALA